MDKLLANKIHMAYPKMTPRERQIADLMLTRDLPLSTLSITQLAAALGCTPSTINRLTRHLGFEGYKDFHAHLKVSRSLLDKYGEEFAMLQRNVIYSIASTENFLNYDDLAVVAREIEKKRRVIFYGEAFTFLIADYYATLFNKIGIQAQTRNIAADLALINNTAEAVNIFVSISGRNPNLVLAFEKVRYQAPRVFCALVTASRDALIAKAVNCLLEAEFQQELTIDPYELPLVSKMSLEYVLQSLFILVYEYRAPEYDALIHRIAKTKAQWR